MPDARTMPPTDTGAISFEGGGSNVPVAMPNEETEELTAEEQEQMEALRGPDAPEVPEATEEPEAPELKVSKAEDLSDEPVRKADGRKTPKVPVSELQTERQKRQDLQKQLEEARERQIRSEERLRVMQEEAQRAAQAQQQQGQQYQDPEPDRDLDPLGWYEWKDRQNEIRFAQMQQQLQYNQQYQQQNAYATSIQNNEAQFAAANPQYYPTLNKLSSHLDKMFSPIYPDPSTRQQVIAYWTNQTVQAAMAQRRNPAEVVYEIAKQIGLTEGEAQQAAGEAQAVQRAVVSNAAAQRSARTLSNVGGGPVQRRMSYQDIANLPDEDYEAYAESQGGGDNLLKGLYSPRR